MDKKAVVLTGVGFAVGVAEALIYYNMGKTAGNQFQFKIPPVKEFMKTAGIVLLTSVVTTALFNGIEIMTDTSSNQLAFNNKTENDDKN